MSQTSTLLPTSSRVIAWPSASPISSPFGSSLPSRTWSDVSRVYRYGFNGKEKDFETANDNYDFGARIYDGRLGKWLSLDPLMKNYPQFTPYNSFENNPIFFNDPSGKDAVVVIKDNTITISTTIFIWGNGATQDVANKMQSGIMNTWNKGSIYTDPKTGAVYNVKFDIKVSLYEGKEKNDPLIITEALNPGNSDNFVEIRNDYESKDDVTHVKNGDEGIFDTKDATNPEIVAHEFGHMVGLKDRYIEGKTATGERTTTAQVGWQGNIMATRGGKVEQKNIDGIVSESVSRLNRIKEADDLIIKAGNANKYNMSAYGYDRDTNTYKTVIDEYNPSN